jgi:RecA/RadA recombinase
MAKEKKEPKGAAEAVVSRATLADGFKSASVKLGESGRTLAATSEVAQFRKRLIHTGRIEVDMNVRIPFDSVLQTLGEPGAGKTLMSFIIGGAAQRTCRHCFTPIITFIDDFGGKPPVTTCQCGKNDGMSLAIFDLENIFDPVWAQTWGVKTNNFDTPGLEHLKEVAPGVSVSPDAKFALVRVQSLDHVSVILKELLSMGAADMSIVDSLAAAQTREASDGKDQPGSNARAAAKIMSAIHSGRSACWIKHNFSPTVLLINQYRMRIGGISPMADPRTAAAGMAVKYAAVQTYKLNTKYTTDTGDFKGLKFIGDTKLSVDKDKISGSSGDAAKFRSYLKPTSVSRVEYKAGDCDEGSKLWDVIKELGEGGLGDKRWYAKSKKGHVILGREFTTVKDIVSFLNRPDIVFMLRLPIFALRFDALQRRHLRAESYNYSPFKTDPIMDLINEATQSIGANSQSGAPRTTVGAPAEAGESLTRESARALNADDPFDDDGGESTAVDE